MWKILRTISLLVVLVYWNTPIAIALPDLNPPVLSREQMRDLPDELLGSDKDMERAELYAEKGWAYYKHRTDQTVDAVLNSPGERPNSFLNAFANAALDIYPTAAPISSTLLSSKRIRAAALCMRHEVK